MFETVKDKNVKVTVKLGLDTKYIRIKFHTNSSKCLRNRELLYKNTVR